MKSRTFLHLAFILLTMGMHMPVYAIDLSKDFNFEGVLLNDPGNTPMVGPVNLKFQIYAPDGVCLLFEETHSSVALVDGHFSLRIGSGSRASPGVDGGLLWRNIFINDNQVKAPGSAGCSPGYTPAANDGRKLRVTVGSTVLTPDFSLSSVPMATVAESLQGKVVSDFVPAGGNAVINGPIRMGAQNELRLGDLSSFYVGLRGPASIGTSYVLTFPNADGTNGQVLSTNGSGQLSWITPAGGGGISTLNGLASGAQTFSVGSSGTGPSWNSAGAIHTLELPLASSAGVTAGLLSYADYQSMMSKIDSAGGAMTGSLQMSSSGTSASPTLQIGSGANNGFFAPNADTIALSTLGAERMRVDDMGNMGLGTGGATPNARLHIQDFNSIPVRIESSALTVAMQLKSTANNAQGQLITSDNSSMPQLHLDPGTIGDTVPEFTVQDNGGTAGARIGINNNMPQASLHMVNDGTNEQFLLQVFANTGTYASPTLNFQRARGTSSGPTPAQAGDSLGVIDFNGWDGTTFSTTTPNARIAAKATEAFTAGAQGTDLIFQTTSPGTSSAATRLAIKDNGNVGVGTAIPAALLDINGAATSNTLVYIKNMAPTGTSGIQMKDSTGTKTGVIGVGNTSAGIAANKMAIQTDTIPFAVFVNNNEELTIAYPSGNVGIGNPTPTAKLDVNGPVKIGPSGSPIQSVKFYSNQTCTLSIVNTGLAGNCQITGLIGITPGDNSTISCRPSSTVPYPMIHSCYISGANTVTVVVQNVSGNNIDFSSITWHVSITNF